MAELNITNIPAPRVPFADPKTGLISREWYRFLLNLFQLTGAGVNPVSLEDLQVGPPAQNVELSLLEQVFGVAPLVVTPEYQAQIDALMVEPPTQVGTMAALQQDNVPYVTFDTTPERVPTSAPGTLYWDSADGNQTLSLVMVNGITTQQIGEEQYFRIKASSAITDGQVVMFTGSVGASGALTGAPATGLTANTALYTMGVATEDIALNGWGYVTCFGLVRGLDTTGGAEAWADGQLLYLDPTVAGGLTKTLPTAPNPKVVVATVVYASATVGSLFVRPAFGGRLGDFEGDVNIVSPASGDLLQYDGTVWKNVTPAAIIYALTGAPITKTADFTVAAGETWFINNKSGSTCTVTLPAAASFTGRSLTFKNMQAQLLVSASSNVVPLDSTTAGTAILLAVVGNWATMVSDGTNWVIMQAAPNNILLLE